MKDRGPRREALYAGAWTLLIMFAFFVVGLCAYMGIHSGQLPTKERAYIHASGEDAGRLAAKADSLFSLAEAFGYEVRRSISEQVAVKPAFAHAAAVCTHSDGVVTNKTTYSRHVTNFVKHENGRHITRTAHQNLMYYGWETVDTYRSSVSRGYCGC